MKLFGVMSMNPGVNYVLVGFACSDNRSKRMSVVLEGICIRSFFINVLDRWLVSQSRSPFSNIEQHR